MHSRTSNAQVAKASWPTPGASSCSTTSLGPCPATRWPLDAREKESNSSLPPSPSLTPSLPSPSLPPVSLPPSLPPPVGELDSQAPTRFIPISSGPPQPIRRWRRSQRDRRSCRLAQTEPPIPSPSAHAPALRRLSQPPLRTARRPTPGNTCPSPAGLPCCRRGEAARAVGSAVGLGLACLALIYSPVACPSRVGQLLTIRLSTRCQQYCCPRAIR